MLNFRAHVRCYDDLHRCARTRSQSSSFLHIHWPYGHHPFHHCWSILVKCVKHTIKLTCGTALCAHVFVCMHTRAHLCVCVYTCVCVCVCVYSGQESAGMATTNGTSLNKHKGMGMVSNIFSEEELKRLAGVAGIGHTRYSTSGVSELVNCQPFIVDSVHGRIALAHNGELVNAGKLRQDVMSRGVGLTSQSDSELILQLLTVKPDKEEGSKPDWPARICHFMSLSQTSYSFVIMVGEEVYAVRDPFGNRPLCLGQVCAPGEDGEDSVSGWVVASESCAFLSMGASYLREVLPGEIVCLRRSGMKTECIVDRPCIPGSNDRKPPAFCIFEYVYFSRADTVHEGQQVYSARFRCGRRLAIEAPVEADIVSTVPESATPAAMGFADQLGLNYVEVLTKNRYVGRTFILPSMRLRRTGVTKKFGLLQENFRGKRVVLVDDSIVRGTTIGNIVRLLKSKGAKEVSSFSVHLCLCVIFVCGGADLLTSHRFRSCICALILGGGGVPADAENSASSRVSHRVRTGYSL